MNSKNFHIKVQWKKINKTNNPFPNLNKSVDKIFRIFYLKLIPQKNYIFKFQINLHWQY